VSAPYAHVAVCVEDSPASRRALDEALRLRRLGPGRLSIVHAAPWPLLYTGGLGGWVPDPEDLFSESKAWLDKLVAEVGEGEPVLLTGYPPVVAVEWAEEVMPDVLVAAAHRGRVQRLLLGSFATYLAYHAPCSVLLVRPESEHTAAAAATG
jgi:nucleotide-binding universal stress UspA family protein